MEIQINRYDFWSHGNALQAFVRIFKQHPQLQITGAEVESDFYREEINGEICSDEYNGCVSLVGIMEGEYKVSWKPGATIEFDQNKFNAMPFEYHLDIGSRSVVADDHPDDTTLHLYLHTPTFRIILKITFIHLIFDEVVAWIASLPAPIKVVNHRGKTPWVPVCESFDQMLAIFERVKRERGE